MSASRDLIAEVDRLWEKYGSVGEMDGGAKRRRDEETADSQPTKRVKLTDDIRRRIAENIFKPLHLRNVDEVVGNTNVTQNNIVTSAFFSSTHISTSDPDKISLSGNMMSGLMRKLFGKGKYTKIRECVTNETKWVNTKITDHDICTSLTTNEYIHKDTCWLCGLPLNIIQTSSQCDHILPVITTILLTGLYKPSLGIDISLYKNTYRWAHAPCNIIKKDATFIKIKKHTEDTNKRRAFISSTMLDYYSQQLYRHTLSPGGQFIASQVERNYPGKAEEHIKDQIINVCKKLVAEINTKLETIADFDMYLKSVVSNMIYYLKHECNNQVGGGVFDDEVTPIVTGFVIAGTTYLDSLDDTLTERDFVRTSASLLDVAIRLRERLETLDKSDLNSMKTTIFQDLFEELRKNDVTSTFITQFMTHMSQQTTLATFIPTTPVVEPMISPVAPNQSMLLGYGGKTQTRRHQKKTKRRTARK